VPHALVLHSIVALVIKVQHYTEHVALLRVQVINGWTIERAGYATNHVRHALAAVGSTVRVVQRKCSTINMIGKLHFICFKANTSQWAKSPKKQSGLK